MEFENEAALKLEASPVAISKSQWTRIKRRWRYRAVYYMRRILVLLLSASLFSILASLFSEFSFLQSYTYYFSTFLIPLFTRIFERKFMFLLCNGILVFLAGKSGGLCSAKADEMAQPVSEVESTYTILQAMLTREQENELYKTEQEVQDREEDGTEDETVLAAKSQARAGERSDKDDQASDVDTENNEGYGLIVGSKIDTEAEGSLSNTEELNKKIEEFIRKMKEELRLEAQQQPIIAA